jgi:hypothetical protein
MRAHIRAKTVLVEFLLVPLSLLVELIIYSRPICFVKSMSVLGYQGPHYFLLKNATVAEAAFRSQA